MKLKHIAAAVLAVASAVPALAAITPASTGNSELFLVVYGTGLAGQSDASYTLDLGILGKSFITSPTLSVTVGGANWDAFAASVDLTTAKWAVMGGDNTGVGVGARNLLTTVQVGNEAGASALVTENLTSSLAVVDQYISDVGLTGTHGTLTDGDSFNKKGGNDYFLANLGNTLNNQLSFDNSNLIGTTSEFTNLIRSPALTPVTEQVLGTLNFAQVGNTYQLVTAVPEPGGVALALTALGMLGFVGRRRKQD
jgi:hypothetical protein